MPVQSAAAPARRLVKIVPDFPPLSIDALVGFASDVVIGRVEQVRAVVPEQGYPYLACTLAIDESLVGGAAGALELRYLGGSCADYDVLLQGAPTLAQGESVLLFLARDRISATYGIVGLAQGTYHLRSDSTGDRRVAVGPLVPSDTDVETLVDDVRRAAAVLGKR